MTDAPHRFDADVVAAVCRHLDDDHAADVLLVAQRLGGVPTARTARAVGIDGLGLDLLAGTEEGEQAVRVLFDAPAVVRADLRTAVVALHRRALQA